MLPSFYDILQNFSLHVSFVPYNVQHAFDSVKRKTTKYHIYHLELISASHSTT